MNLRINKKIILITFISIIFVMSFFGVLTANAEEHFIPVRSDEEIKRIMESSPEELKKQNESNQEKLKEIRTNTLNKLREKASQGKTTNTNSEFIPLAGIPGVTDAEAAKDPSKFFNGMFMFGISIAAFLAVLMIAIGGIQYMSTDAVSGKTEGKERIQYAVMGLLLVLFSWILLRQINPEILNFNFLNNTTSSYSNPTTGASSGIKSQSGSKINSGFIEYSDADIYVGTDEKGRFYKVTGEDKNGNEIRFYPDLQNDPNPEYTIQQSSPQPRQSIKKTDTKDFTEPNEIYNEGIMTDNQRLKRAIDEMNKGIFNN